MLSSSREKNEDENEDGNEDENEGTHRGGEGGGGPFYANPDLRYYTGSEGESSARTINGMEKKRSAVHLQHTTAAYLYSAGHALLRRLGGHGLHAADLLLVLANSKLGRRFGHSRHLKCNVSHKITSYHIIPLHSLQGMVGTWQSRCFGIGR